MNQYYLIPKQIIDSRIEELQKASEKYYTQNHLGMQNATNDIINLLQSLTQQSELVEVEKNIDKYYTEMEQSKEAKEYNAFKFNKAKSGYFFCDFIKDYHKNHGFKLIKTIKQ